MPEMISLEKILDGTIDIRYLMWEKDNHFEEYFPDVVIALKAIKVTDIWNLSKFIKLVIPEWQKVGLEKRWTYINSIMELRKNNWTRDQKETALMDIIWDGKLFDKDDDRILEVMNIFFNTWFL